MKQRDPIYLSPPHVSAHARDLLLEAFDSNWIAPLGPMVNRFEKAMANFCDRGHAVALNSGTAALHLLLQAFGVGPGDRIFVSTLTFVASVNAIRYCGATPVLIDSDRESWNMDPALLEKALQEADRRGELPKAVLVVDIYGQCADYKSLREVCGRYEVPVLEDAAEAVGSKAFGKPAGKFGRAAAFSFNGNKILTTSGGGMFVTDSPDLAEKVLYLSTQACENTPHYEHHAVGYNYRLSNLLAAVGCAQLEELPAKIEQRRALRDYYQKALGDLPGISFMPVPEWSEPNFWLQPIILGDPADGVTWQDLHQALAKDHIESRPLWKPMHRQPIHAECLSYVNGVSDELFTHGLCLPSGTQLQTKDLERITEIIRNVFNRKHEACA